jgi:uncharacterized protein YndB with AHSA1/START domain
MSKSKFVYVTYIRATPEQIWNALLEPKFTRQYWECENVSDWKPGSRWEHRRADATRTLLLVGEVVESERPRRLVWTWAAPADATRPEKRSRVTFDIERIEDAAQAIVRLTVTHDELEPGSDMERGITEGWPRVLASLKSLLETGQPLNTWAGKR